MTDDHGDAATASGIWARSTAPQTEFTASQVGIGLVVLVIGLSIVLGLPLLLA